MPKTKTRSSAQSVCLLHKNPAGGLEAHHFCVLINTADASSAPQRSIFKSNFITGAFTCLLHLVAILSRGALRSTRAWKTNRTLDAIAAGGTHVTFLSLNIGPIGQIHFFLGFANEMEHQHSQELPSLQQGQAAPGGHSVQSGQLDLQAQQHLSLQENPVIKVYDNQEGGRNQHKPKETSHCSHSKYSR